MKWQKTLFMIFTIVVLAMAWGRRPPDGNGAPPPARNGENGVIGDTTQIEGTVEYVNEMEGILVLGTTFGEDTLFFTNETEFPQDSRDMVLRQGAEIRAWYIETAQRKTATRIEPKEENGIVPDTVEEMVPDTMGEMEGIE